MQPNSQPCWFLLGVLGGNLFPCLFQILDVTSVLWLTTPSWQHSNILLLSSHLRYSSVDKPLSVTLMQGQSSFTGRTHQDNPRPSPHLKILHHTCTSLLLCKVPFVVRTWASLEAMISLPHYTLGNIRDYLLPLILVCFAGRYIKFQ